VKAFTVEALTDQGWKQLAKEPTTTIGYKRILRFPTVTATQLRFTITDAKACPLISKIGIYLAPQVLTQPTVVRNKEGEISITPADSDSEVYYSVDGSQPTSQSLRYKTPIPTVGKVEIKTIAYEPATKKSSPVSHEKFDISKKEWRIAGVNDERAYAILDGNRNTSWSQNRDLKMPIDLVIDLGKTENLTGFRYLPGRGGVITHYQFFVSKDNKQWTLVNEGEFSNIQNNPLLQEKAFAATEARYIKFRALKNTRNNDGAGYAEFEVVTK
jgi:alpha-L-fucosidase